MLSALGGIGADLDPLVIEADDSLLRQAIDNLVRNAVRRATRVELVVREDNRDALIEVNDDGPGFPPDLIGQVFERFRKGDTDRDGTGLGLAIVRAIAEAHGGTVSAENRAEGGASLQLRIPRPRA